jgi:hypothetical protein
MERRIPLARGKPLTARKPLQVHNPLTSRSTLSQGNGLQRRTELPRGTGPAARPTGKRTPAEADAWSALRQRRWALSGGRCDYCGNTLPFDEMECHHRVLTAHGGPDAIENTLALHALGCHVPLVHGGGQASYDRGFLVHRWDDPAQVPVLRHGKHLVYPTANGWVEAA